jgi:3D (Asp-Asp-Asp) domain-containing protein
MLHGGYPVFDDLSLNIRMDKSHAPYKKLQNLVALLSIGLSSYPGLSPHHPTAFPVHRHVDSHQVLAKTRVTAAKPALPLVWISVTVTSYCWQESDHIPFGRHNCMGGDLTKPMEGLHQCAADLNFYPLGSILYIQTGRGGEIRIVTDCGKAVRGPNHLDLHFNTLRQMEGNGTRKALIFVVRWGWRSFSKGSL